MSSPSSDRFGDPSSSGSSGFRSALGLLTIVGGGWRPEPGAGRWFAPVGAGLGLAVGAAWVGANEVWPPAVAAAVVVALDLALTGLLHVDGLADTADGLLPPLPPDRRLAVMRAPDVGAFGVATVVVVLLARWAALASQADDVALIAGLWATSRAAMALALATVPAARADGMAASFRSSSPWSPAAGAVGGLALAGVGVGVWGIAAGVVALASGGAVVAGALRRIGGVTGDVLGATGLVAETVGLVVAAAR